MKLCAQATQNCRDRAFPVQNSQRQRIALTTGVQYLRAFIRTPSHGVDFAVAILMLDGALDFGGEILCGR